ncbi:PAS domain S-box protein [Kribbella pittospori]|uniref:protein-glutamate O-methyltransferase n=1 Tax=Kribbella pittospori TaxID=722689 RepID=A0A4R0JYU7_9ACTN|nr:CheR family methyltransferase [Kribbella pittospori]TCC51464.1 PAS domain S-box protein [Kribbella pittospori]
MDTPDTGPSGDVEDLLDHLRESRGFDFRGYKRTSLLRRIQHRLDQLEIGSYGEYIDRLQIDVDEFTALFNTILINVTGFFRDPEAWDQIGSVVIPKLVADKEPGDPIRVWSAGCSSGQEAYSIAMLLAEALGAERYLDQVKIYATDVDHDALAQARHATFDDAAMRGVPDGLRDRYFERRDHRHAFRHDLRRTIIFGRNDLVQDAPISRIDLLICRNTLMYFNAEAQARILGRFHFAVVPDGVLFLGKAEMLLSHGDIFEPLDLKRRIFRRAQATPPATPRPVRSSAGGGPSAADVLGELRSRGFSASPVAQFVVTVNDDLAVFNDQARETFGLHPNDIGSPLRDLEISYRPAELRTQLAEVKSRHEPARITDVEWQRPNGVVQWFEVQVNPLLDGEDLLGVSFVFDDVTIARTLRRELERTNRQLEATNEELQSTNEELETTNEELQSTVEELETTNEELQSTNEELETINEELQSTNDELKVINDALGDRSTELNRVNDFLQSILTGIKAGVVVIDQAMQVIAWNAGAEELWGVHTAEAEGRHLLDLDIGLPMTEVKPVALNALSDPTYVGELRLEAVNRRGRTITLRLVCSALSNTHGDGNGALLVMETVPADAGTSVNSLQ